MRGLLIVRVVALAAASGLSLQGCRGRFALPADARFVQGVAIADSFGCARMKDGSVRCWGANESGQLGDGTRESHRESVKVALPARATAIAVGPHHACAIAGAGDVYCWGASDAGQAGASAAGAPILTPTRIDGLHAKAIALGARHSCAVVEGGAVRCWGADDAGQGSGASGATGALAITASANATCIIDADHRVACWGAVPGRSTGPAYARVDGLADITSVALGPSHACAVRAWGGVACWGEGQSGQLGAGSFSGSPTPVDVVGLAAPAKVVVAGRAHSCASLGDDSVRCWGANAASQLADGTRANRASGAQIQGVFEASAVAAGGDAACAVLGDGSARCWGGLALPKTETVPVVVPTEVRW